MQHSVSYYEKEYTHRMNAAAFQFSFFVNARFTVPYILYILLYCISAQVKLFLLFLLFCYLLILY